MGIFVCAFSAFFFSRTHTHTPLARSHIGLDSYSLPFISFHSFSSQGEYFIHWIFLIFFIAKGHAIRPYFHYFHFSFPLLWSPGTHCTMLFQLRSMRTYFVRIVLRPCSIIRLFLYFAVFGHPILTRNLIMYKRMMKKNHNILRAYAWQPGIFFPFSRADE